MRKKSKKPSVVSGRLTIQVHYRAETTEEDAQEFRDGIVPLAKVIQERMSSAQHRCSVAVEQLEPKELQMIQYHEPVRSENQQYDTPVIRSPKGSMRRQERLRDVRIVDGWKLSERLKELGLYSEAEAVLDLWQVAIDLRANMAGEV